MESPKVPNHLLALFLLIESVFDPDADPVYLKQAEGNKELAKDLDKLMLTKRLEGMNLTEDQAFEYYTEHKENRLSEDALALKPAKLSGCLKSLS